MSSSSRGVRLGQGRTDPYELSYAFDFGWLRSPYRTAVAVAKTLVTLAALTLPVGFALMLLLGLNANVIVSGSMQPALSVGSLVIYETVEPEALERGDVISFARPGGDRAITTHRIVAVEERDGTRIFQTKGDNNAIADPWLIRYDAGQEPKRMIAAVPYVGHLLIVTKGPLPKVLLIVLALAFVYATFLRVLANVALPSAGRRNRHGR